MSHKKILLIANDFSTIYNFRMELIHRLVQEGYEVVLALPDDDRNVSFEAAGCAVEAIPLSRFGKNPAADFKTMIAIRNVIRKISPSVVLTYTAKPNIYGGFASRLEHVPYVCNVTGLGANLQSRHLVGEIMLGLQRVAFQKAKMVFFQNQSNLDFFRQRKIVRDNFGLLPGSGVNISENPYVPYQDNKVTKFISVARIRRDKGYDELFDVIKRLKEAGIEAEFHIVGWYEDESYKRIVEQMVKEYRVVFHENMPHARVHELIAACDCLVHPSHHEGMSNVVLEAAAAGRACIVSDIPGCRECVENGKTGLYFAVKDAEDLYEKICAFIKLSRAERETQGKKGHEKMKREFDREIIIEKYIHLIRESTGIA